MDQINKTHKIEHHTVIIVGGGPAGLPIAAVLGGWHPYYRESAIFSQRYPELAAYLSPYRSTLLGLDFAKLGDNGIPPIDLFHLLHHPRRIFQELSQIALEFRQEDPIDYLLITQEEVGGLWNNAPENLLTLSPGQWMEFAFYPLAQYIQEQSVNLSVNDLICKRDLIRYYHQIPGRFDLINHIHTHEKVVRIEPHERGFHLTSRDVGTQTVHQYTCKYLVYAVGQRCILRKLDVPGEDLPFVVNRYDRPESFDGDRIVVVGGGRSADWAATELYDAQKEVYYVMRQSFERHWRLINDSRDGLPYYARIAEIIESRDPRFQTLYNSHIQKIEDKPKNGLVTVNNNGHQKLIDVDHVVIEIGGTADYSLFNGFPALRFKEKYDSYRFQVHQVETKPYSSEVTNIPNLYMGGYLAEGLGLVVIAMHPTTYTIAADILQKEGIYNRQNL